MQETVSVSRNAPNTLKPSEINLFRMLLLIGAIAVPLTGFFYTADPSAYDPWPLRISVGVVAFVIVALSFLDKSIKKYIDIWYYIYLYIFVGWTSYLFTVNHFLGNYLLGVLGTFIFIGFARFRNTLQLILYLGYYTTLLGLSLLFVTKPVMNSLVVFGVSYCFIVATYLSTQTKRSIEHKLEESEHTLFTIFNESADAIFLLDPASSKISDCNDAAIKLLGGSKIDLIDQVIFAVILELFSPQDNISYEVIKNGFFQKRGKAKSAKGKQFWADMNIKHITIRNKKMFLVRVTDITIAMEFEEKLRTQKDELERLNAFMVGRELKITELKKQLADMETKFRTPAN